MKAPITAFGQVLKLLFFAVLAIVAWLVFIPVFFYTGFFGKKSSAKKAQPPAPAAETNHGAA